MRRLIALLAVALAAALLVPATAGAGASPCPPGMRCLTVKVPRDRSGALPGTIDIPVAVERGSGPVLLVLMGGPGQSGVDQAAQFAQLYGRLAPRHRIAALDQRGTGTSAIDCPALQAADLTDFSTPPPGGVRACGDKLGPARAFYATTATVADLEDVRRALDVPQLALLGISYGTYVAERYARAFPDRVSHLVLDSVVPQESVDPLLAVNMRQGRTVLRELCARGACRRVTADVVADVARLVQRIDARPITGRASLGNGHTRAVRLDPNALFDLYSALASFYQAMLIEFPAAVRSALQGDPQPLLRMYAVVRTTQATPASSLSWGLHTATLCADVAFPWGSPVTDPATRPRALADAVARLDPAELAPFNRSVATNNGVAQGCVDWPATNVAPPPEPGPLPAVPTLLLAGTFDLSTPIANARQEARRSSTAQLAVVPFAGHSLTGNRECVDTVVRRFFAGAPLGRPCADQRPPRPILPAPALPPGGRARQARAVVRQTIGDVERIILAGPTQFGGLRGGSFRVTRRGLVLRRDELIAGAPVTGRLTTFHGPGTLFVGGQVNARVRMDARGRLHVRLLPERRGAVTG